MVVVESAVTSIYICYAEDPLLIHRWDAEFFNQMSETLHQRLQYRSARVREVLSQNQLDGHIQESIPVWIIILLFRKRIMFSILIYSSKIYEEERLSVPVLFELFTIVMIFVLSPFGILYKVLSIIGTGICSENHKLNLREILIM